jgi:hypothetical protein
MSISRYLSQFADFLERAQGFLAFPAAVQG